LNKQVFRRYEAGATQPSLEVLKKNAVTLHVSIDSLVFNTSERDPDDELKLQFEAIQGFTEQEKLVTKTVLEGLILKHDANRFSAAKSD
jgi:transcriptional regulator with XRE-family HTH domain